MMRKTAVTSLAATVLVAGLCGCAPDPFADPTPPPTPSAVVSGFASDEEAFAAAEATYRAYVDALNEVDLARPETFEPLYDLTTGEANRSAREEFMRMHDNGWRVSGTTVVTVVDLQGFGKIPTTIKLSVCADVGDVEVFDASGDSVVSETRADVQPMTVTLSHSQSTNEWAIEAFDPRSGEPSC